MNDLDVPHPGLDFLTDFGLGRVSEADAEAIHDHLEHCAQCRTVVEAMPDDTFASLVRSVGQEAGRVPFDGSATVADGEHGKNSTITHLPTADGATSQQDNDSLSATCHVPAPLLDHPRYRILEVLGVGGMGCVYKAEHRLMGRTVALKVISPKLIDRPGMVERFRREVQAAARLAHSNIVGAFDAEQAGDAHFLVMEFVEGVTLDRLAKDGGAIDVSRACDYIRQAALGLQHAFEHGMVHRDVKPHNLMLTPRGIVKILDFGLAQFASENAPAEALTAVGTVMGTPDYIAPEQARDAHSADIRADIYSLGCTLYFLLTGAPPFPEGSYAQKLTAHLSRVPQSLSERRSGVPAEISRIVDRMLAKDPGRRYQTPQEVAAALAPFVGGAANVPEKPRRPMWNPVAMALLLAALGLGGAWFAPVIYRFATNQGELVVETDDPDVEVIVKKGGELITILDPKSKQEVTLRAGAYELELGKEKEGLRLSTRQFTLHRGGKEIVWVRLEPKKGLPAVRNDDAWAKSVAAMPGEKQIQAVAEKLRELNPGFDGKVHGNVGVNGVVETFSFVTDEVTTIAPVHALKWLKQFTAPGSQWISGKLESLEPLRGLSLEQVVCGANRKLTDLSPLEKMPLRGLYASHTGIADLTPLKGMPLTRINMGDTLIRDLSPLEGMRLEVLHIWATRVTDITPLKSMPLKELILDYDPRYASILHSIKTLEKINNMPVKRFWAEVDAGRIPPPGGIAEARKETSVRCEPRVAVEEGEELASHAISPDSGTLLIGRADGKVSIWDLKTAKRKKTLPLRDVSVQGLAFAPDGKTFAMAAGDYLRPKLHGKVTIVDLETGKTTASLSETTGPVYAVAYAPDGKTLASAGMDGFVRLWELASGKETAALAVPGAIHGLTFSPDGQTLVAASSDSGVRVWDVAERRLVKTLKAHADEVDRATFSPDGSWLATASRDRTVQLWNTTTWEPHASLKGHTAWVYSARFSPNSKLLASADGNHQMKVWDVAAGREVAGVAHDGILAGADVSFAPSGDALVSCRITGTIKIWDVVPPQKAVPASKDEVRRFEGHTGPVRSVALSPDGKLALSASGYPHGDRTVRLWDTATGKEIRRLIDGDEFMTTCAFSPDGKHALSAGADRMIRLWDVASGKELRRFEGHTHWVNGVAFTPDGRRIVSCSGDLTVRLWNAETGDQLRKFEGHTNFVQTVVVTPDGRRAISGGHDKTARLWDLETGKELGQFSGENGSILAIAPLPDNRRAYVGTDDGWVRTWELATGKELQSFRLLDGWVASLALSPDGRRGLAACTDKTIRLWDVASGKELHRFEGHENWVQSVVVSADGRFALSGGGGKIEGTEWLAGADFSLRLWRMPKEEKTQQP